MNRRADSSRQAGQQELFASKAAVTGLAEIPDKLYFKIGEVSAITGVEPYVLRYWETAINAIKPQRAASKQRLYRRADIENIITVKKLIQEEGFTITGARKFMAARKKEMTQKPGVAAEPVRKPAASLQDFCREMKVHLREIKKLLEA